MATSIGSYVFFDLETTDLPGLKTPKITEISLIACSKQHLLETRQGDLPRVLHKQTLCLNPQRIIHPRASEQTGLYNDLLEHESKFDDKTAKLILLFLERLRGPCCLVAHNGNRFDFLILKREFESLNIKLPEETYCIDSLQLFQELEKFRENQTKSIQQNEHNELIDLEVTALTAMEELEGTDGTLTQMQKINETTPQRCTKLSENYKRALRSYLDVTPSQECTTASDNNRASPPRSKRQLFPDEGENSKDKPQPKTQETPATNKPVRKRFRLCDVYERYYGTPPKISHYAEADVKALLKCAIADAKAFVHYSEQNCVRLCDVTGKI
ncbi:three-prime repair exonuclease 1 [Uranotaenia lowii]|uniref:three-prime repair exonuclease 1 n=1 Tax=Uranotaenia lowii TaxID=190385 RepID=UPI00247A2AF1|nr:three-prime repair exonuclease 1 [Uranotaenia lowii]